LLTTNFILLFFSVRCTNDEGGRVSYEAEPLESMYGELGDKEREQKYFVEFTRAIAVLEEQKRKCTVSIGEIEQITRILKALPVSSQAYQIYNLSKYPPNFSYHCTLMSPDTRIHEKGDGREVVKQVEGRNALLKVWLGEDEIVSPALYLANTITEVKHEWCPDCGGTHPLICIHEHPVWKGAWTKTFCTICSVHRSIRVLAHMSDS